MERFQTEGELECLSSKYGPPWGHFLLTASFFFLQVVFHFSTCFIIFVEIICNIMFILYFKYYVMWKAKISESLLFPEFCCSCSLLLFFSNFPELILCVLLCVVTEVLAG